MVPAGVMCKNYTSPGFTSFTTLSITGAVQGSTSISYGPDLIGGNYTWVSSTTSPFVASSFTTD